MSLEAFGEQQRPLSAVLAELDRMERWIAQVRNECAGIEAVRANSANRAPAEPSRDMD